MFDGQRAPSPDGFVYGFSHFNQEKSSASKRGYSQVLSPDLTINPSHLVAPEVYRGVDTAPISSTLLCLA